MYFLIPTHWPRGWNVRQWSESLGSIPRRVIPKTLKMVLDTSKLNTQRYKVCIKGKVEQSRERSSTLPYTLVFVAIEKEPSSNPRLKGDNFTFYIHIKKI